MPAPHFRENFYDSLGQSSAYKTGAAHTTAAAVVAAPGAGKQIRLKAFIFTMCGIGVTTDHAQVSGWLADGTTAVLGVGALGGNDVSITGVGGQVNTGLVTLPAKGITLTANTALNIDFDAIDANVDYQLTVFYDVI